MTETAAVSLTLTNLSRRTRTVTAPEAYGFCMRAFRVFDAAGREAQLTEALCFTITAIVVPQPIQLRPGESVTAEDEWEPSTTTRDGQPISPGTYRIVGTYHAETEEVTSRPISIVVVP